jgi:serine/threonine-protein kinase
VTPGTSYSPPPAFGRFRLLHQIGAGVLGPVFRTHDEQEERLVAVKAFTLDITPERAEELSNHLQRVVDIDLEHPHVARPIGTGVVDSVCYLAQQYVAGESLDAAIRQYGPAPASDAARLISHVAEALDLGARVGVFHGSLHPRDILVTPGETHVTGLGVSMALEQIGQHGPIRRPYAAPEREAGLEWGAAADVFSLAVIAYEVLTGRRALPGTEQPLPGLADVKVAEPAALRELLEAAIDPEPERRPAHAGDFARALAAALVEGGVPPPVDEKGGTRRKSKPRAPKLPGLDEPLILHDTLAEPSVMPALDESGPVVVSPDIVLQAVDDTPSVDLDTAPAFTAALGRTREAGEVDPPSVERPVDEPADGEVLDVPLPAVVDWDVIEAETERAPEPVIVSRAAGRAAEPEQPVSLPLDELPELSIRPAPPVAPASRYGADGPEPVAGPSLFAADPGESEAGLPGPRLLDPIRESGGFAPTPRPVASVERPKPERWAGIIAITAVGCLLVGLLAGYEIGARWGRPASSTAGGASAVVPAAAAPAAVPVAVAPPPAPPPAATTEIREPELAVAQPPVQKPESRPAEPAPVPAAAAPPAPRAAERRAPASEVLDGRITVRTVPAGAQVELDGDKAGVTPRTLRRLAVGTHTIRVSLAGYELQEKRVALTTQRPSVRLDVTLKKSAAAAPARAAAPAAAVAPAVTGTLIFASRPAGAHILVDGKDVGVTPFTLRAVAPGLYKVELRLAGHRPWTTSVTVDDGKPQRVTGSLERDISR